MSKPDDAAILQAETNILALAEELARLKKLTMLHKDWCAQVEGFTNLLGKVQGSVPQLAGAIEARATALESVLERLAQAGVDARSTWAQIQIALKESSCALEQNVVATQELLGEFKKESRAQWSELQQKAEIIHDRIGKQVGTFLAKRFQEELVKLDEACLELKLCTASNRQELNAFKQDVVAWMDEMNQRSEAEFARHHRQVEAILCESAQIQLASARMQKMMPAFGLAKLLWAIAALVLVGLLGFGLWYALLQGGLWLG